MSRIKELMQKSIETLRIEGVKGFYIKTKFFIKGKIVKDNKKAYKDIFVVE